MQLIKAFVDSPVKVAVGVLLLVLFGFVGAFNMPMQLTPEVQIPTMTITTRWFGAAPQEVEREIILEQEEQLKGVEGVTKMTSECMNSEGAITLEFAIGTDIAEALLRVNTRLQQVPEYPEDADEPVISLSGANDSPIAWFILRPRVASREEIAKFQKEHPDLAPLVEPARLALKPGLRTRRLLDLVAEKPELAEKLKPILPPDIEVPKWRLFAEDEIEARFERVDGVSNANVFGGREEEMQVIVNPELLAARQLTITDVNRALRARNRDASAGDVWDGKRRYVVRVMGQFREEADVADVIIAQRDGMPVYVRDVAEVKLGYKKPQGVVKNFGMPCIAINTVRTTGANVLDTMAELREVVDQLNADLLRRRGLELVQVYDETEYIYSAIGLVRDNIVVGGLLTIGVLLLFLRSWRSTIVIALAIPTCIIGTFLVMSAMGRTLNVISLAGLAFAVGMLVDNAVVVLENIYRRYEMGEHPFPAAVRGAQEVWGAVVASTLTTLAVFVPVLFIQEEAGQLFRDIALAISAAVALSMLVSITVIPPGAARILRKPNDEDDTSPDGRTEENGYLGSEDPADNNGENVGHPAGLPHLSRHAVPPPRVKSGRFAALLGRALSVADGLGERFVDHVVRVNGYVQRSAVRQIAVVAAFVCGAVVLSWLLWPTVEYLPNGNRNLVFGQLLPPAGYNVDHLLELGAQLEQRTRPFWDVNRGDPELKKLPFPPIDDYFFVARGRMVFFGLRSSEELRAAELVPLVAMEGNALPGTIAMAQQASIFGRGLSSIRSIDVEIVGPDPQKLVDLGTQVMGRVQAVVPGSMAFPRPSLDLSSPEVHLQQQWVQAADMGLSKTDFDYAVTALVDGAYAGDYYMNGRKIDLTIIGRQDFVEHTQDLKDLPIATPSGDLIPLAAVANQVLRGGPEQINRRERQRAITIVVSPPEKVPLEKAIIDIQQEIIAPMVEQGLLGDDYQIRLAGTADKLRVTWEALRWNFLLALLITYLLMAALFESWLYPLVIIVTVPLGAVGGLLGLWLLNWYLTAQNMLGLAGEQYQSLDVLTMLGFVILIGTVVNNPILIVHQSLNHMRFDGMQPRKAILESVRNRIRPIFMTTTTTVFGLLPLVLFPGAGSELYRGLGAVVLGGLVVSTAITLIVTPSLFILVLGARSALLRRMGYRGAEVSETAARAEPEPAVAH
ncbi:MAG: efflux RND transporter permease subunit [Planctomycetota bacterium]